MKSCTMCVVMLTALYAHIKECGATNNLASTASRGRVRRETSSPFTQECIGFFTRAACSTSYYQDYIDAISHCGEEARYNIQFSEEDCQKNAEGRYCGDVLAHVDNDCSLYPFSSCSQACNISLQRAGCCANNLSYSRSFSNRLRRCGLPEPSPCPQSNLTLPAITSNDSCDSVDEFTKTEIAAVCNNYGPVLEELSKHEMCDSVVDSHWKYCSSRNGQYCLVEFNYRLDNSFYYTTILPFNTNCTSATSCSMACKSSLISVKNTMGCCFHALSVTGLFSSNVGNESLWNECGIAVPQRCSAAYMKIGATVFTIILIQILAL